jgi:hypothetical protein
MSGTAKATAVLIERLNTTSTVMLSQHLAIEEFASADGRDALNRPVLLVGAHALRSLPAGEDAVKATLAALAEGHVPAGVHSLDAAAKASQGFVQIVEDHGADEVLLWGERQTGKTVIAAMALPALAELHVRAGYELPLKALWLHASLVDASLKTGASLEEPMWSGLWSLRNSRTEAVFTLGGVEMVVAHFIPTTDPTAKERLRAAAHVMLAEELLATLTDGGGIGEREYAVARSSALRLPTRRRVAIATSNPGAPTSECWPYRRFILDGGEDGCVGIRIPASDRLTEDEQRALHASFQGEPELQARLARGEWIELPAGERVVPGFTDEHIAQGRLRPKAGVTLVLGHDGGHTPVTIIGSRYQGSVEIYAALASTRAGTRQHVTNLVKPWLAANAPWALRSPSTMLRHAYDPSMETGEQADIDQDPVRVLRELLGGPMYPGAIDWPARIEPVTAVLGQFNAFTSKPVVQIDAIDGEGLIRAARATWVYPVVNGRVSKDLPKKPNHPHEDHGDALCYFVGAIAPSKEPKRPGWTPERPRGVAGHPFAPNLFGRR